MDYLNRQYLQDFLAALAEDEVAQKLKDRTFIGGLVGLKEALTSPARADGGLTRQREALREPYTWERPLRPIFGGSSRLLIPVDESNGLPE